MSAMADQQRASEVEQMTPYAAMFDELSDIYDQSGVPFFGVIARGLVDRLRASPGEHALDVGAGRGAVTLLLADAVGPTGRVDALDLAPGMVRLLRADTANLPHVHVTQSNAADPRPPAAAYDLVSSSLVIFFLDDPVGALKRWRALLRPGGRVGITTFQEWWGAWLALSDLYDDSGVESMLRDAGFAEVRSEHATYAIAFADLEEWQRWSWATPMGGLWRRTPETDHPEILRRAGEILEANRDADGRIVLEVGARYTFGLA
jgi:SAM-dependent methyltransferase